MPAPTSPAHGETAIEIGLNAAIVAVGGVEPLILVVSSNVSASRGAAPESLPFGLFDPLRHRTMEIGLRSLVEEQTALRLGYVEQLYTFGDRGRHLRPGDSGPHVVSVGYLALARPSAESAESLAEEARWRQWYGYFPWEDWRDGRPAILADIVLPRLEDWWARGRDPDTPPRPFSKRERVHIAFGIDEVPWDEERVLDRYELLYEAGLVEEARRDGRRNAETWQPFPALGRPMRYDHRRILATAISRLRAKLKYRPVVFELMPQAFTLTALQRTVEAISGRHLHKQNFRRLVERGKLVEPTGEAEKSTGGRPAALFRFRREVIAERPAPGLRLGSRG